MKTIYMIVGTRPEAIKMAPVYHALQQKKGLNVKLISTGQHQELLYQALSAFGIKPYRDLQVMQPKQSLSQLTAKLLMALESLFQEERPDLVLAHGDTSTSYSAALSCFFQSIPFYHVEAGLRTYKLHSPFPEEFNRQAIAQMARHHFAPTTIEEKNLLNEGIKKENITVCGNTIQDAIKHMTSEDFSFQQKTSGKRSVVFTLHRREGSTTGALEEVMSAIKITAEKFPSVSFISPVHPNPTVKQLTQNIFKQQSNISLLDPMPYPQFLNLLRNAEVVLTDSGGVQEEASYFGKKVFIVRDHTERYDGLNSGNTRLIGTNKLNIVKNLQQELICPTPLTESSLIKESIASPSNIVAETVQKRVCL